MEKNTAFRRHIMTQEGEMDGRMDAGRREMRKGEKAEGGNEEEKGKGKKRKEKKKSFSPQQEGQEVIFCN